MSGPQKSLMLFMFLATAVLRILFGSTPAAGGRIDAGSINMPSPPSSWVQVQREELRAGPDIAAVQAVYRAPDGSLINLTCLAAWPDRRNIPVPFYPNECNYLGQGWDFEDRGSALAIANNAAVTRIIVKQKTERRLDLSAYACDGRVFTTWHDFKTELIWQRLRRQRRPWLKVSAIAPADTDAARGAPALVWAAVAENARLRN